MREAAVAGHDGGHTVKARRGQRRVPEHLGVVVRVDVDEAGGDDAAVGVERAVARQVLADLGDLATGDGHVGPPPRLPVPSTTVPPLMTSVSPSCVVPMSSPHVRPKFGGAERPERARDRRRWCADSVRPAACRRSPACGACSGQAGACDRGSRRRCAPARERGPARRLRRPCSSGSSLGSVGAGRGAAAVPGVAPGAVAVLEGHLAVDDDVLVALGALDPCAAGRRGSRRRSSPSQLGSMSQGLLDAVDEHVGRGALASARRGP